MLWLGCRSASLRGCVGGWSSSPRNCLPRWRKDQRRWGKRYLHGLMLDGKRKSIEPMAARLAVECPRFGGHSGARSFRLRLAG